MKDNLDLMIAELEGAIELARQIPPDVGYPTLTEARMGVIGQRLNRATEHYNALGEELDGRVNALDSPVADVDADAWSEGDVNCPNCDTNEPPVTDMLHGGRVTRLRCSSCGYTQGAS